MTIYLGTGGYSDPDLLGVLYPATTKKTDFLAAYSRHYSAVEINSSFYAPLGQKAFPGMVNKSQGRVKFAIKLHQDFSHRLTATAESAAAFLQAITPILAADCLASLLIQFPHGFDRTLAHRQYLANLVSWFAGLPIAIEFRHESWHIAQVYASFSQQGLSWCSVDYPDIAGLPPSRLIFTNRTGYLRLHGKNVNWWDAHSAAERHDYRYNDTEMQAWAQTIANQKNHFDQLYIFFENTVKGHAVYNIATLARALAQLDMPVHKIDILKT